MDSKIRALLDGIKKLNDEELIELNKALRKDEAGEPVRLSQLKVGDEFRLLEGATVVKGGGWGLYKISTAGKYRNLTFKVVKINERTIDTKVIGGYEGIELPKSLFNLKQDIMQEYTTEDLVENYVVRFHPEYSDPLVELV